eukprot:2440710-Lingulodinium_polyedra.AAC.1
MRLPRSAARRRSCAAMWRCCWPAVRRLPLQSRCRVGAVLGGRFRRLRCPAVSRSISPTCAA